MGIVSTVFVLILALCVVVDSLLGLIRGRNRSLLRLGLVVLSAVISLFAYKPITNAIMGIQIDGYSISETILEALTDSAVSLPESIFNLIIALVQIVLGVLVFVLVFFAIKFLTWLVAFPILKIFVRPEKKKNKGLGALIGFAQGLLVAIIICGCFSGFLVEGSKIAQAKIGEEQLFEMPEELMIKEYVESPTAKFFDVSGGWLFDIVSTTTDASGRKVSISSLCNTASTIVSVSGELTNAFSSLENIEISTGDGVDTQSMKAIGDAFVGVGTAMEGLDDDSKQLVSDLMDDVKEIVASEYGELPPEFEELLDSVSEDVKIKSAGEALNGIVKYVEEGSVTQDDINDIVNGIADNMYVLGMLGIEDTTLIEIDDVNIDNFRTAIENAGLTQEDINTLYNIFGLN